MLAVLAILLIWFGVYPTPLLNLIRTTVAGFNLATRVGPHEPMQAGTAPHPTDIYSKVLELNPEIYNLGPSRKSVPARTRLYGCARAVLGPVVWIQ